MSNVNLNSNSRVMVVGTSGSGKSTFSRKLSVKLGLKDIELDALFWGPDWTQTEQHEFRLKIENATKDAGGWVMHGNYGKVRDITWRKATTLVWLDYPRRVVFWRVFKRSVARILTREPLWSGNRETFRKTFLSKESILLWSFQTYKIRKRQYEELTKSNDFSHLHIIRCKAPCDAEKILTALGKQTL